MDADSDPRSDPLERDTVEFPIVRQEGRSEPARREQILVVAGDEPGRTVPIGESITLGRGSDCDFVLTESGTSRRHARIGRQNEELFVEDLDSRNGTFVNGTPVSSHPLAIGDRVQLGPKLVLLITREDPLEAQLHQRAKMEAIGRMAAGVAHDFNNVAVAALTTCDHLESQLEASGALATRSIAECFGDLRLALERAADLTRSLSGLGRRRPRGSLDPIDLAEVCDEVARLCERTFGQRFEIRRRWTRELFVRAYRTELHQILLNLCLNARDAMSHGGVLRIGAERGSGTRFGQGDVEWILLRVADTGTGMSEEVRRRVFDPFFSTKLHGHGSGLGLATVHELVTGMQGRIEVESAPGSGTVFLVWLPSEPPTTSSGRLPIPPRRPSPVAEPAARPGRILVVEDLEIVRRSIVRLLRAAGHEVSTAGDGAEALRVFERASPRPDLVLLDLDLPILSGDEALTRLRQLDPTLDVILISGHWDPDRHDALLRAGAAGFLGKPFDAASLRGAIARVLGRRSP